MDTSTVATFLVAAVIFALWVVTRSRIAARTVGRAREDAARLIADAEREAQTQKKEAELAAKEQAHAILQDSERQARERREELASIERQLALKTRELTEQDRDAQAARGEVAGPARPARLNGSRRWPRRSDAARS